jgi:hypothetical protein
MLKIRNYNYWFKKEMFECDKWTGTFSFSPPPPSPNRGKISLGLNQSFGLV